MTDSTSSPRPHETIVIVPCYNEARRIDVAAFDAFLDSATDVSHLFVDDGSTDDTPLVLEKLRQRHARQVCTLRLSTNVGKAEAVRRGVQAALRRRPQFVGYWDADLATPLETIPRFSEVLRARPHVALVMGSRVALLGRQIRRSGLRHFLGRAFATAASIILRLPVYDTQCGAKLFRATPGVAKLFSQPFRSRWIFDVEIMARMIVGHGVTAAQVLIYEYPLERWQDVAGSKLKPRDFLVAVMELAAIYWRYVRGSEQLEATSVNNTERPAPGIEHRDAA
jgi:glycosyltransferase involved in cell wall biosynthesis